MPSELSGKLGTHPNSPETLAILAQKEVVSQPTDGQTLDAGNTDSFVKKTEDWLDERPTVLFAFGLLTVVFMCFISQILIRFSKFSNVSLNKYYRLRK